MGADRLDPELFLPLVDVAGRRLGWRSSSAEKKGEADLRISLALRNSRFSFLRLFRRSRSSVVSPGRRPSVLRIKERSVSADIPSFSAMPWIAAHCDGKSSRWSKNIRTARSRTSCGYLVCAGMAPSSSRSGVSLQGTRGGSALPLS